MRILWLQSLTKKAKPSVLDEAEYIFSLIFRSDILDFILVEKPGYVLNLSTWVGGDKDGHPGVDKITMLQCLNRSRNYLINYTYEKIENVIDDLNKITESKRPTKPEIDQLVALKSNLARFKIIANGDGAKIKTWTVKFKNFLKKSSTFVKTHSQIILLNKLLDIFPAFVLPIELREDASLITMAVTYPKSPIKEMLQELSRISGALNISAYTRGLVISHCEQEIDLLNAMKLVDITCKNSGLRIIPLFESSESLINSRKILKGWLKFKRNQDRVFRHWGGRFEVMLGYSDSAKQMGVLPSRYLIAISMQEIERTLKLYGIKPIFFHGSGGSVARGGGSLKEQISWWSPSAIEMPKMTIQGEMIQRLFASEEILNSQCGHLTTEAQRRKVGKHKWERPPCLNLFVKYASDSYQKFIGNSSALEKILEATPYQYLSTLKLGSRPSRRPNTEFSFANLRAIPWILSWTQSRILLPTWWGLGSAWKKMNIDEKNQLKAEFLKNPFFSSFIKTLGFSMAKVDWNIANFYLSGPMFKSILSNLRSEFEFTSEFLFELTSENKNIWHKPWLEESIQLRSPTIHILNLIQILAMKNNDEELLRDTITGIACGMLTTG